ncbi:MAG: hypothetical protein RL375_4234 [Pseudomonadota bacterium]
MPHATAGSRTTPFPRSTSSRQRHLPRLVGLGACLALVAGLSVAGSKGTDGRTHTRSTQVHAAAVRSGGDAVESWRGQDVNDLTQRYWRWLFSIPYGVSPDNDAEGVNCGLNQQGPVWFLSGPLVPSFTHPCTMPAGKAIVTAVNAFINDFPCPDPSFAPSPGQGIEEFLQVTVAPFIDGIVRASATIDDKPVRVRRVTTGAFGFTAAADLVAFDSCVTGSPQVGISDGYMAFVDPLPPGRHVLRLQSLRSDGSTSEGIHILTVK